MSRDQRTADNQALKTAVHTANNP
ncbi:MAG: hypothetical protein JMJ95_13650 [Aminivibrio sp.]|nr:hypothetical protein [Aminivibrio sp.]